jgi:hypothetical protein
MKIATPPARGVRFVFLAFLMYIYIKYKANNLSIYERDFLL